jgi:tripartite-type tricarboxylate transporter receptor subunit TctC
VKYSTLGPCCVLAFGLAAGMAAIEAGAQAYPARPIRLIIPFSPGGAADTPARVFTQRLSDVLGQPVVIENRPGAGSTIGADLAAKALPDGYTLFMISNTHFVSAALYKKLPYDSLNDFSPVTQVTSAPNVLVVHASLPAKSIKELIALAKARPRQIDYASSGNGSTQHLAGEMFKQLTGTNIVHVPYKGSGDAIKDLLAGTVNMNFDTMPPVLPHIQSGRLRGLAISTPKRLSQLPDVPTFEEEGIRGFDVTNWYGVMAPGGTPREIVLKLNADINKAMQVPEVRARLEAVGTQLNEQSAAQFEAFMKAEVAKYAKLIKDANIRIE